MGREYKLVVEWRCSNVAFAQPMSQFTVRQTNQNCRFESFMTFEAST